MAVKHNTGEGRALLQVENLHTVFHTDAGTVKAVNGVEFSLRRKQILGLVGESGCGKTVTGLSILGLIPQPPGEIQHGRIMFEGTNLLALDARALRRIRGNRIAMIFQEPMTSLNPIFSVGYQLKEVIRLHKKLPKQTAHDLAVDMLQRVGLPDPHTRINEYPHQMSGGMRQRVMIAMALCCDPGLIIADEPTTALDVTIQAQIMELINLLREETGTAILLITHDLGVIAEMADQVAVMYTGAVVEYASADNLFENPSHPYTQGLMQSIPKIDRPLSQDKQLPSIPGIVPSLLDLPTGCAFRDRCPETMKKCATPPPLATLGANHHVRCWLYAR